MNKHHLEALQRINSIAAAAPRYDFRELAGLFSEIQEIASSAARRFQSPPELIGPYAGCKRTFYHYAEAYYSKSLGTADDRLDEVGFSIGADEGGTAGEFCIRWFMLSGKRVAILEVFDEAWGALALYPDLMAKLAALTDQKLVKRIDARGNWSGDFASITPEDVCEIALECGLIDATKRIDPYAKAPPPTYSDPRDAAVGFLERHLPVFDGKTQRQARKLIDAAKAEKP
jgi:hypothetical protein